MKKALVFGGSGLVGGCLINELENNDEYSSIIAFVRAPAGLASKKTREIIVDLNNSASYIEHLKGDVVFICLGTTIKKAGSIEKMEHIDRDIPIEIGQLAIANKIKQIGVVSSIGANANSRNYYLRIKGEMENGIKGLDFDNIVFARPSVLLGNRKENRFSENLGKFAVKCLAILLVGNLRKYRAVEAKRVAKAIINILEQGLQEIFYESDELETLGK